MSGHSKWSSIKHKKGAADAKRGKLFTKLARAITVAARDGGGNLDANPALGLAVQKARDARCRRTTSSGRSTRGTGEGDDAAAIESILYEGYGPGGAAILVETLSDNRNRTGSEVRHAFEKHGGSLGRAELGRLAVRQARRDPRRRRALRRGRPDGRDRRRRRGRRSGRRRPQGDHRRRRTCAVRAPRSRGSGSTSSPRSSRWSRRTRSRSARATPRSLLRLMDSLEEHDDVDSVHANFDIPEAVLERAAD